MEYTLGLYEKSMPGELSFAQKLAVTAACGFDQLELSVDETDEKLERLWNINTTAKELRLAADITGTAARTICLSAHRRFPLGSHESAIRAKSLDIMSRAIALSCEAGIRIIQLAGYDVYYEETDDTTRGYFMGNLARATELAAGAGVLLGFETMETPFMDTVQKATSCLERVPTPYLGIYPDIGNLKNASVLYQTDVVEDLKTGSGHILAAHLKETLPGVYRDMAFDSGGHTEYKRCIAELWRQGVRTYTGEFWYAQGSDYRQSIKAASVFLRKQISSAMPPSR